MTQSVRYKSHCSPFHPSFRDLTSTFKVIQVECIINGPWVSLSWPLRYKTSFWDHLPCHPGNACSLLPLAGLSGVMKSIQKLCIEHSLWLWVKQTTPRKPRLQTQFYDGLILCPGTSYFTSQLLRAFQLLQLLRGMVPSSGCSLRSNLVLICNSVP